MLQLKSVILVTAQFTCIVVLALGTSVVKVSVTAAVMFSLSILISLWSVFVMQKSKLKIFPSASMALLK